MHQPVSGHGMASSCGSGVQLPLKAQSQCSVPFLKGLELMAFKVPSNPHLSTIT